jgi:pyruvyltransferase
MQIKKYFRNIICLNLFISLIICRPSGAENIQKGLPLYYWQAYQFTNFGDYLSLILVQRIVQSPVRVYKKTPKPEIKLLAIGSIFGAASNGDIVWGSGINGKFMNLDHYHFTQLDVRAVRGPLTRQFLMDNFQIDVPEIYGDPALLFPYFFPEFKKKKFPTQDYIIIPHYSEEKLFPKEVFGDFVVYPTESWDVIIKKILNSKFVISSSLHGIILAEAYGIPARLLKLTNHEPLFKYQDYYLGTNRPHFQFATSLKDALEMGGETSFHCDLEKLYQAFPFEFWPRTSFKPQLRKVL